MKTLYLMILLSIFLCSNARAQSNGMKQTGIQAVFSEKSIKTYQEISMDKVSELYQYLTVFSDKSSNVELKKQLRENIFLLFSDNNIKIYDFLSPEKKLINLPLLLDKIENKSCQFTLKPTNNSTEPDFNYWINQYSITIKNGNSEYDFLVNQKIYFSPNEKSFGAKSKTIWDIKLGEVLQ